MRRFELNLESISQSVKIYSVETTGNHAASGAAQTTPNDAPMHPLQIMLPAEKWVRMMAILKKSFYRSANYVHGFPAPPPSVGGSRLKDTAVAGNTVSDVQSSGFEAGISSMHVLREA